MGRTLHSERGRNSNVEVGVSVVFDLANYSTLTLEAAHAWKAAGVNKVIVGIPHMPGFTSKVGMLHEAGIEVEAYQFANYPPMLELLSVLNIKRVWVDVEIDKTDPMSVDDVYNAFIAYDDAGFEIGIYTNAHAWRYIMGLNNDFSDLPLWWANPSGWPFTPFGGWTDPTIVQHTFNAYINDVLVDINEEVAMSHPFDIPSEQWTFVERPALKEHLATIDGQVEVVLGVAQVLDQIKHGDLAQTLRNAVNGGEERVIAIDDQFELNP